MTIPRARHPRPQFYRDNWQSLNGEWDFAFDFSRSGLERGLHKASESCRWQKIIVPFCPESSLSGIGYKDFIPAAWYRRNVALTAEQLGGTVLLHFGAVDYSAVVFVNETEAGRHIGGYGSFTFDITRSLAEGDNTIAVYVEDDTRSGAQPSGKQSDKYDSYGCFYTRTTGIWQTVWLEFVPKVYISRHRVYPNVNDGSAGFEVWLSQPAPNAKISVEAFYDGKPAGRSEAAADGGFATLEIKLLEKHVWDIGSPCLYDLVISLENTGAGADSVNSYFGLRSITMGAGTMNLNGRPVFQRLVLDQGFYPDGIYTAPSDDALKLDITLSMSLGFNGARLHEKVFEERFLYHADKLGYLVWGEYANWGFDHSAMGNAASFIPEWLSVMERDFNHPSLIGWCPFNETWDYNGRRQDDALIALAYQITKMLDPTRPVIDTSGNYHVATDIYDVHDYEQDPAAFRASYGGLKKGEAYERMPDRQQYRGQPFFVSEYGGTHWDPKAENGGWGYGNAPATEEEFVNRYDGLTSALLNAEGVCALCYTQLYDVEQEKNGLFTYDRKRKLSDAAYERILSINSKKAAIER